MGLGIGKHIRRIRSEIVPGVPLSLLDLLMFRQNVIGPAAPMTLYGRWRSTLAPSVPPELFGAAGLEDMHAIYPAKYDRQLMAIQALRKVLAQGVQGEVAEFGTYRGHTAVHIAQTLRDFDDPSRVFLFDSFAGLPASGHTEDAHWQQGDLASSVQEVRQRFSAYPNVELVQGFFNETLPKFHELRLKFAHVDADLYSSIREVNDWLLERVVIGGCVVYDDYGHPTCPGAKKAVDETVIPRRDYFSVYVPTGQLIAVRVQ